MSMEENLQKINADLQKATPAQIEKIEHSWKDIIHGGFKSKTVWLNIIILITGIWEVANPTIIHMIPEQQRGIVLSVFGLIGIFLRGITTTSLAQKAIEKT